MNSYAMNIGREVLQALNIPADHVRSVTIELDIDNAAVVVVRAFLKKDHLHGITERLARERWVRVPEADR
jgi:hypothetical protein